MIDNKFAVMKFITRHKLLFSCLIIAWIIGMIFTVFLISRSTHTKMKVQRMSHPLIHPLQHNRLPPASSFKMVKAMRYCNPPNDITQGQEGSKLQDPSRPRVVLQCDVNKILSHSHQ
ncbi:uncharacterized protein TNCV_2290951 [Trichonephila clavipes]|uniref:Uncharacterized protein n=1 Tax=Trichonephila clavipes TaxID=2585209 RepID=A0A8X6RWC2_TRICX|nr:uncharacterized protein TNCV_2290951 [Trichonephila clavipes]